MKLILPKITKSNCETISTLRNRNLKMIKSINSLEKTKEVVEADIAKEVASRITMMINNQQMNIKEREMSMRKTNNNSQRSNTTIVEVGVSLKKKILDKIMIMTIMMLNFLKKKLNNIKRNMMIIQKKMEITSIKEKRTKTVAEKEVEEITVEDGERKSMFKSLETKVIIKSTNLKDLMIMKINAQEAEITNVPEVVAVEEAEVVIETTIKTIGKAQPVEINKDNTGVWVQKKDTEFKWEDWDWESVIEENGSTREAFEPRGSEGLEWSEGLECQKDGEERGRGMRTGGVILRQTNEN